VNLGGTLPDYQVGPNINTEFNNVQNMLNLEDELNELNFLENLLIYTSFSQDMKIMHQ
jgi:hypothetical protein